jgi:hypothetical protein
MLLLAIDTGTLQSAYVVVDTETYKIITSGKISNEEMLQLVRTGYYDVCVVEMFSSYGARVGKEVFESVVMIGRVLEACYPQTAYRIPRRKVKEYICGRGSAVKDADVIQALKDRFGSKGTKTKPGFFYGTTADMWQAFALATAYIDMRKDGVTDFDI